MQSGPVVQFESLKLLRGVVLGLRQPAMTGRVRIGHVTGKEVDRIVAGVGKLLPQPLPPAAGRQPAARLALAVCHWVGAAQREARIPVGEHMNVAAEGEAAEGGTSFGIALPVVDSRAVEAACRIVLSLVNGAASGTLAQREETARGSMHEKLRPFAETGVNRHAIIEAALWLDVPVLPYTPGITMLGCGAASLVVDSTITERTPSIGVSVARLKHLTARLLRAAGLPGAVNKVVRSPESAVAAARSYGYPVVVKPADRDRGEGVAADLRDDPAVVRAYTEAARFSSTILVEKFCPGSTHRLTVFNGRLLRVTRRIAGGVVGDGVADVRELVARAAQGERQQRMVRRYGRTLLALDDEALELLAQDGLGAAHVPAAGQYVRLRRRDNVNAGGDNEVIALEAVHPDNVRLAIDTASLLRLDFAGIDLITRDISRSWMEGEALVCEVNAQPQLGTSSDPHAYRAIVAELVGGDGRIPARLVVCPAAAGARTAVLQRCLASGAAAVSDVSGLWIGGEKVAAAFEDGFRAARALWLRKDVTRATCLMSPDEIVSFGLPLDRWDEVDWAGAAAMTQAERDGLPAVGRLIAAHVPAGQAHADP